VSKADACGAGDSASSSSDLLESALRSLPVGVVVRESGDGPICYMNDAALRQQRVSGDPVDGRQELEHRSTSICVAGKGYDISTSFDVSDYRWREAELTKRAFFDDLTGLPKRELFERSVNGMIQEECQAFALSFIDIDNFKYVNDYYGHAVGDQLLKKIARRISDGMRPSDLLARVGGDEFVLLTSPVRPEAGPILEIEHLARRFREPFFIDGYEIFSSASIGVSIYPSHGQDYATLSANADRAMYRVKGSTKGAVSLFDAGLGHVATERMEAEQRLRLAIRDRRLGCAFQPKVDFRTNEIVGIEVLLRWLDDNGDFRPPGDLIKVAIEVGLMDDVALTVLDQVTGQIDLINDAFGPNAGISLNVAAKQATDVEFMTKFAAALQATGYAQRFTIELTEEAFLSKGEFQLRVLPMLREIGVKVSIDDFGVGYSSLSALAEITADELKVDRSFVTDIHKRPRNQSVLKVIELLGQSLGMQLVVEGVETFEELAYLSTATRISQAQGFYFSKPVVLQSLSRSSPPSADRREGPTRDAGHARHRATRARH
jgi:diguanylate cyclase (GGDEF)-like protein